MNEVNVSRRAVQAACALHPEPGRHSSSKLHISLSMLPLNRWDQTILKFKQRINILHSIVLIVFIRISLITLVKNYIQATFILQLITSPGYYKHKAKTIKLMLLLKIFTTHLTLAYSYRRVMIRILTIWCHPEDEGFHFGSSSSQTFFLMKSLGFFSC